MNKWIIIIVVAALFGYQQWQKQPQQQSPSEHAQSERSERGSRIAQSSAEEILQRAFEKRQSNIQIEGRGVVKKTLPDDNKGSRHQRFILQLSSGQTLLVAHNIDLAERIKGLKKGDTVGFYGEYEWSQQGGVIHWTHHDPRGRHADGWLQHNGKIYH